MKQYRIYFIDQLTLLSESKVITVDDDEVEDDAVEIFKHQFGENREIEFVEPMF